MSSKLLSLEERLIIGADYKPEESVLTAIGDAERLRSKVDRLAESLANTGVTIKLNSGLRVLGPSALRMIHHYGLRAFADYKLNDIPETLATDGSWLRKFKPELLTVMCSTGAKGMRALKEALPETEILGVTVLTSLTEEDCLRLFGRTIKDQVMVFAREADEAGIDGLIASPAEATMLRNQFGDRFTINTPAIRPALGKVIGDDQNINRVMTPLGAFKAGSDRIVVGRPVMEAEDKVKMVEQILAEIDSGLKMLADPATAA